LIQFALGLIIGGMYANLGIDIIHVPLFGDDSFWLLVYSDSRPDRRSVYQRREYYRWYGRLGLEVFLMICLFGLLLITSSILDVPLSVFIALWLGGLLAFFIF